MKAILVSIIALACVTTTALGRPIEKVGEVIIIGNTITQDHVIRAAIILLPGQILRQGDLRQTELNISKLGLFDRNPGKKRFVYVLNGPGSFKDVLIYVKEKPASATRSVKPLFQFRPDAGVVIGVAFEERNFDPWQIPTCVEDFLEGKAFRGGGEKWRFELGLAPLTRVRLPFGIVIRAFPDSIVPGLRF